MISSIDKMHLQRVEMGDEVDKGRTDTIQETIQNKCSNDFFNSQNAFKSGDG